MLRRKARGGRAGGIWSVLFFSAEEACILADGAFILKGVDCPGEDGGDIAANQNRRFECRRIDVEA